MPQGNNKLHNELLGECFSLVKKAEPAKVQIENQPEGMQDSNSSVALGQHPHTL